MKEEDRSDRILVRKWDGYQMTSHQREILKIVAFSDQDAPQIFEPISVMKAQSDKPQTNVKDEAQQIQYKIFPNNQGAMPKEEPHINKGYIQTLNMIQKIVLYHIGIFNKKHRNGKQYYRNRLHVLPRRLFGRKINAEMIKTAHNFDAMFGRVIRIFLRQMPDDSAQEIQTKRSIKLFISQLEENIRAQSKEFKTDPIPIYLKDEEKYVDQSFIDFFKRNRMIVKKGERQNSIKTQQQVVKQQGSQILDEE